jgi:hypothetical protein
MVNTLNVVYNWHVFVKMVSMFIGRDFGELASYLGTEIYSIDYFTQMLDHP